MKIESRILGGLYGSLVGDALGVPVEFKPRADRVRDPVMGMRDYGTHGQPKGTWSDDGALLLCSVESLVEKPEFDPQDMGERFVRWWSYGLWTAHGVLFDIGFATRAALKLIEEGCPAELAGGLDEHSNGNGSLMRILPVAVALRGQSRDVLMDRLFRASAITHGHDRSKLACVLHGLVVEQLLRGLTVEDAVHSAQVEFRQWFGGHPEFAHFSHVLDSGLQTFPEDRIGSGGYVMDTLTASLWCLLTTSSFSECVLKAVNLGDDTDTTGCVAGGLAGLLYGLESIPADWISALPRKDDLRGLFDHFLRTIPT